MAIFVLLGVLRGFPVAAYRRTPSCPAVRGPQTLACPVIALFQAAADAALRLRQGFDGTSDQNKKMLISELDTLCVYFQFMDGH
jgi:hypothetical protein